MRNGEVESTPANDDLVGVVAIGRNEGARLTACLDSVRVLGLPVVYVDSGSTDGSPDAARSRGAQVVLLDASRPFTAAWARAEGAAALLAQRPNLRYIQFVDGDCAVNPSWIGEACRFLDSRADVAAVCGRRRERYPAASVYNRLFDEEWATPVGETTACGGDALFRCKAFSAAGGFDEAIVAGEEPELCGRLRAAGWRIWRLDAEMTLHDANMHRLGQWWRRNVRGGFGYAQVWMHTRHAAEPLFGRQLARALGWGFGIPLLTAVGALLVKPLALAGPSLLILQVVRQGLKRGGTQFAWTTSALLMVGKFAEARGVLSFAMSRRHGALRRPADYK